MSKCVLILGKTCSGKNYTIDKLINAYDDKFFKVLQHTDRPIRCGEINGIDYIFHQHFPTDKYPQQHFAYDNDSLNRVLTFSKSRRCLYEKRTFRTNHGTWNYWTDFSEFSPDKINIIAGDPHVYHSYTEIFNNMHILYCISSDGVRLKRYLERKDNTSCIYDEIIRRNRMDDYDHSYFFNHILDPKRTPITFLVGDIDPEHYIRNLQKDDTLSSIHYLEKNGTTRRIQFSNFPIQYDDEKNLIKIGTDDICINLYTLDVTC